MSEEKQHKLTYFIYVIGEFANRYGLTDKQAFRYLKRYDGMSVLDELYPAEHTLPIEETVNDLAVVCHRNGGGLI
jgi:hypothetical protein